jgi:GAF domain-containing protein
MQELIKKLVLELGASSGAIMVVDEQAKVLRCGASYNMPQVWIDLVNPLENTPDKNRNGRVAITGIAETVNNYNVDFHDHHIGSIIVVPVKHDGKVVANIELIAEDNEKRFTDSDQKILEEASAEVIAALNS